MAKSLADKSSERFLQPATQYLQNGNYERSTNRRKALFLSTLRNFLKKDPSRFTDVLDAETIGQVVKQIQVRMNEREKAKLFATLKENIAPTEQVPGNDGPAP